MCIGKIIMHIFVMSIMCLLIFWLKTLSFIRFYGNVIVNNNWLINGMKVSIKGQLLSLIAIYKKILSLH